MTSFPVKLNPTFSRHEGEQIMTEMSVLNYPFKGKNKDGRFSLFFIMAKKSENVEKTADIFQLYS